MLPRKYHYLYESRDAAKVTLKVFAEEQADLFVMQGAFTSKYMAETYGVHSCVNLTSMRNSNLDHLFDYFCGFLFSTDKGLLTPGDVNPTLIEAFNFAHEYSSK